MKAAVRTCVLLLTAGAALRAADATVEPVTVCELMAREAEFEGRPVLVIGRYSFRSKGRFLGQEGCGPAAEDKPQAVALSLAEDDKAGPKVPQPLQIDGRTVEQKLERMKRTTSLARFRFGSTDYDRWAAVYCTVEKPPAATAAGAGKGESRPGARLLIRGDGAIIFLGE